MRNWEELGLCPPDDGCGLSVDEWVRLGRSMQVVPQIEGTPTPPNITAADIIAILAAILPLLGKGSSGDPIIPG